MKIKSYKNLATLIALICGAIALFAVFIFNGATYSVTVVNATTVSTVKLIGLVFSGATINASMGNLSTSVETAGGLSYFGLASFVILILGLIVLVYALLKGKEKIDLLGYLLLLVAGILMFFVLKAGTDIEISDTAVGFADYYEKFSIAFGVYLYSILAILGGVIGFAKHLLKK